MQTPDDATPPHPRAPRNKPSEVELSPSACRRRRLALGLSTYELAQRARLEELTVIRFEAALVRPRQVTVVALHNTLRRLERADDATEANHRQAS